MIREIGQEDGEFAVDVPVYHELPTTIIKKFKNRHRSCCYHQLHFYMVEDAFLMTGNPIIVIEKAVVTLPVGISYRFSKPVSATTYGGG